LRQAALQSKSVICSIVTSAGGKATTTTSRGKRSTENASFRIPATLKALGDPLTIPRESIVRSLRLELYTLIAGAFWRKMSIEKSVNFLQPRGTFSCGSGVRAANDSSHSAGHPRGYRSVENFGPLKW